MKELPVRHQIWFSRMPEAEWDSIMHSYRRRVSHIDPGTATDIVISLWAISRQEHREADIMLELTRIHQCPTARLVAFRIVNPDLGRR